MRRETIPISKLLNQLHQRSHFVRDQRVVLDEDAAILYGVSAGQLRRMVARHKARFPPEALFRMTLEEYRVLKDRRARFLPYVFTEEGVLLLSSVLKTPQAVQASIEIIRELFSFRNN
jgi:hypothetical protein